MVPSVNIPLMANLNLTGNFITARLLAGAEASGLLPRANGRLDVRHLLGEQQRF